MNNYQESLNDLSIVLKQQEKKELLHQFEEAIFTSKECISLIDKFQKAQDNFNFVLTHFPNDETQKEIARSTLVKAKKAMDNNDLINKYNTLYNEICESTLYIEEELRKILSIEGENKKCSE